MSAAAKALHRAAAAASATRRRRNAPESRKAIKFTQDFVRGLLDTARVGAKAGLSLKQVYEATKLRMDPKYGHYPIYEHCMPFDVSRAYDEASGIEHPRIWTARRDMEMWKALQA